MERAFRRALLLMLIGVAGASGGCRLAGLGNPVPASLASSRQLCQQGIAALDRGQVQDAETTLAKAAKTCPTNPDAHRYYAETLWLRGAKAEAVAQLEEACRLNPDDAGMRGRLAEMHLAMGRVDLARHAVEQAIAQNPRLPATWAIRGRVMRASGDLKQALADYQRALGYTPDDRQVLSEVAEVYRQLRQPQQSLETLHTLAETFSPGEEPPQVLYQLGMAYLALERYADGAETLALAAAGERPNPEILSRLAEAQWLCGRTSEAVATAQQALSLDPRQPSARELLARIEVARQSQGALRR